LAARAASPRKANAMVLLMRHRVVAGHATALSRTVI
jgi:hypothetical protein